MPHFYFFCIAGTGKRYHDWCHNVNSPFMTAMREEGGEPIRRNDGTLYDWSGKLNGTFWTGEGEWRREADRVEEILTPIPVAKRILFTHSHGGQIAIILAARGFRFRTLTTFATPYRPNLGPDEAAKYIGFWQHVYDPERDVIATLPRRLAARFGLGGIGGGGRFGERRFMIPGVLNVGIPEARHSRVFTTHLEMMKQSGVLKRAWLLGP